MTKIFIVDDHQVVIEGVKAALTQYDDLEVVGEATDGREAIRKVQSLRPHIVIMDIAMPQFNGIEATFQIKKVDPKIKIIVFTMHSHREFLVPLVRAGISGYVVKEQPISDLYLAIKAVKGGATYFVEDVHNFLANHVEELKVGKEQRDLFDLLSPREREVFQLLAEGRSVREAADLLFISHKTVETHKYNIMEKLSLRSMTEWTKEAIRKGIIEV